VSYMNTAHASGMAAKERQVQLTLRVPPGWVTRLEKLAEIMSSPIEVSPTAALRYVVEKGLEAAEAKYGIKVPAVKKASK
jgi:hypothetical protein